MTSSFKFTLSLLTICTLFSCTSTPEGSSATGSSDDTITARGAVETDTIGVTAQESVSAAEPESEPAKVDPAPTSPAVVKPASKEVLIASEVSRGESLIQGSDCLACHTTSETLIGPSYKEVAAKYSKSIASITYLAKKIKEGGSGAWGDVPMTPHPALSDSDAKAMAQYVLSLK